MKVRHFFLLAAMLLTAVGSLAAQDIQEKRPIHLSSVEWAD